MTLIDDVSIFTERAKWLSDASLSLPLSKSCLMLILACLPDFIEQIPHRLMQQAVFSM